MLMHDNFAVFHDSVAQEVAINKLDVSFYFASKLRFCVTRIKIQIYYIFWQFRSQKIV